jgi:uncharacterized protein (TIGR03435 family)
MPKKSQSTRSFRLALLASLVTLIAFFAPAARAQTAAPPAAASTADAPDYVPTLTFDIASIRPTDGVQNSGLRVGVSSPPHTSKFTATNFTAKSLIQAAYGFDKPISTGPDWISEIYYNVEAKSDPSIDAKLARLTDDQAKAEKMHMLQALLADRFHLKVHTETKESSVYAMTIAKSGSKLQQVKTDADDPNQPTPSSKGVDVQAHGGAQGLEFDVKSASMRAVVGMLASQVEAPVVDRTGLPGYYDFTLQFGRPWSASNPESWPDIFTAVQEQLGLKLDRTKADVPNIIIYHIEATTEN